MWAGTCVVCQHSKVHRHTKAPLVQFLVPERTFNHVNMDLVGPLPPSWGYTHLLTMVDRIIRWPEAMPLSSRHLRRWLGRSEGPGSPGSGFHWTSPLTEQFMSELWNEVAGSLGVKLHHTTAYHPQAN